MLKIKIQTIVLLAMQTMAFQLSNSQWVQQNSPTSTALEAVTFIDSLHGWIAGLNGTILHTTNGGLSWNQQESNTNTSLCSISFCDSLNGWAVGFLGVALHTTNAGKAWLRIIHDTLLNINNRKVQCLSPTNALILRDSNADDYATAVRLWKTTNAGVSWIDVSPRSQTYINWVTDFDFVTSQKGWACGTGGDFVQGCQVHRTTNGGSSWNTYWYNPPGFNYPVRIYFENDNRGWMTDWDTLYRTTNGGVSWNIRSVPLFRWVHDLIMKDSIGYVVESSSIKKTTDNGLTWFSQQVNGVIGDVELVTQNSLWAVGNSGIIFHTSNGGLTSTRDVLVNNIHSFSLMQNYPNPFNPTTYVNYDLPGAGWVKLAVYDIVGREVEVLIDEYKQAGNHYIQWNASGFASGIYFMKLSYGSMAQTIRLSLVK